MNNELKDFEASMTLKYGQDWNLHEHLSDEERNEFWRLEDEERAQ